MARDYRSIIDYRIVNNKLAKLIPDTRVFRRYEMEPDHFILVSPVRPPFQWLRTKKQVTDIEIKNF
jgi:hypothetical protein